MGNMRIGDEDDMGGRRGLGMGLPQSRVGEAACGERVEELQLLSVPNKPRGRQCRALTSEFCPQRKHGPPDLREDCEVADR